MSFSSCSSFHEVIVQQLGGTSHHGRPAMLRQLCSATSPHNNNAVAVSNVLGVILTSWGPNILCGSLLGHVRTQPNNASAFTLAINVIRAQFLQYRRRIHALEAEVEDLRHDNMMYHSDVGALESELSNMRVNYYTEVSQRHHNEELAKKDQEEIKNLQAEIAVLKRKNALAEHDKDEINLLKAENSIFKAEIEALKATYSRADLLKCEEVRELRAVLDEERSQAELDEYEIKLLKAEIDILREEHRRAELDKCEIKLLKAEIFSLKEEHSQAERFIRAMVDIKLYDSVLSDAARAVLEGDDAEDVLIEAVKSASTRKGSPWSRIIPAVVGPRTPEHYLSAIEIALRARKEVYERRKVANFWKFTALTAPANTGVITPSSSQISDICDEMAKEKNRPRVKESVPAKQLVSSVAEVEENVPATPVAIVVSLIEPSGPESRISEVIKPSINTIAGVQTESTETIKISTPTSPPPQSGFIDGQNEDESRAPSEQESTETSKPVVSDIEIAQAVEDDMEESLTVVEQSTNLAEEKIVQPESTMQLEIVFLTESIVLPESVLQPESTARPVNFVQSNSAIKQESTINEEFKPTSPFFSERPSTSTRSTAGSQVNTPSKLSRSSPAKSKLVTPPQEKTHPRLISPFKSPSPNKFSQNSRVAEFLQTSRKNSELFVKPLRTLGRPMSPIRSRLSTPRNHTLKRPVLRNLNLNIPASAANTHKAKEVEKKTASMVKSEAVATQILPKPMNKDLRKRRGVILVEKVDIDRSSNKVTDVRRKSQEKVQNMPRLPSSASTDVFCDRSNVNAKKRNLKTATEPKSKDAVKPVPRNDTNFAEVQPVNQDLQPIDAVLPTTLMVSRLVEHFSDSDLGSLEMTSADEDSDSDCEEIRRVQNEIDDQPINLSVLPHIQRALAEENSQTADRKTFVKDTHEDASYKKDNNHNDDLGSTSVLIGRLSASAASASNLSAHRTSRPATPYSKSPSHTFSTKDSERLSPSTSGSSYTTSSSGSISIPAKRTSRLPLLGLAQRLRHGNGSTTPVKATAAPSSLPVMARSKPSLPAVSPVESAKTLVPSTHKPTAKPLAGIWNMRNKASVNSSEAATPLTPPRKVAPSISAAHPKQTSSVSGSSYQRTPSVAEAKPSKPSMGQSFIRRLSNVPVPNSKSNTTLQSVRTNPIHLAPPSPPSPGSLTKPRSHTINTVSPLPPTLSTPSPEALRAGSTKPRSHTVNTYSPTTRSPLSRLAADASAEYKANQSPKDTRSSQVSPPLKSLVPKSSSARTGAAVGKFSNSTLPLRVHNKAPSSKRHGSSSKRHGSQSSEEIVPAPPTAAFMRPAVSPASNTKRMTNSIAPLIPNWTPASANGGGLTPKQCRSMFRNSLSMVVR